MIKYFNSFLITFKEVNPNNFHFLLNNYEKFLFNSLKRETLGLKSEKNLDFDDQVSNAWKKISHKLSALFLNSNVSIHQPTQTRNETIHLFSKFNIHCIKYARIRVFTDPYSPVTIDFVLIRENMGQ